MYSTTTKPRPAEWLLTFALWAGLLSVALATTCRLPAVGCGLSSGESNIDFTRDFSAPSVECSASRVAIATAK